MTDQYTGFPIDRLPAQGDSLGQAVTAYPMRSIIPVPASIVRDDRDLRAGQHTRLIRLSHSGFVLRAEECGHELRTG